MSGGSGTCARWCAPPPVTPCHPLPPPATPCHPPATPLPPPCHPRWACRARPMPPGPPALHAAVCAERACCPADAGDDALHAAVLRRHAHHHRLAEWHRRGPRRSINRSLFVPDRVLMHTHANRTVIGVCCFPRVLQLVVVDALLYTVCVVYLWGVLTALPYALYKTL